VALLRFANEFFGRVNRRIDLAPKFFDGRAQRFEHARQRHAAHDHEVDVATGPLITARYRAVNKRGAYRVAKLPQAGAQQLTGTGGFSEQAFQLGEHRCLGIRLETDRRFIRLPQYQSQVHHYAEFPMRRARTHAGFAGDLAQMKPFIGVPEQQR
jgi:hypothetical protein